MLYSDTANFSIIAIFSLPLIPLNIIFAFSYIVNVFEVSRKGYLLNR